MGQKIQTGKSANLSRVTDHTHGSGVEGDTALGPLTALTAANNLDIGSFELRARTLQSDVATGTAPLVIASTTKVSNLNADLLDDLNTGNASGNIPINNGTLNTNLNAQLLNGRPESDFAARGDNESIGGSWIFGGIQTFNNDATFNGNANFNSFVYLSGTTAISGAANFTGPIHNTNANLRLLDFSSPDPPLGNDYLSRVQLAKAWVEFSTSGGVATMGQSFNVVSVVGGGDDDYRVIFDRDFSSATSYVVLASSAIPTPGSGNGSMFVCDTPSKNTAASCYIVGVDKNGNTQGANSRYYRVLVFGTLV